MQSATQDLQLAGRDKTRSYLPASQAELMALL